MLARAENERVPLIATWLGGWLDLQDKCLRSRFNLM